MRYRETSYNSYTFQHLEKNLIKVNAMENAIDNCFSKFDLARFLEFYMTPNYSITLSSKLCYWINSIESRSGLGNTILELSQRAREKWYITIISS